MRAFIAIDFPDEIVKEIARVQGVLGNYKFTGKVTELENLHLTLKFLGEVEEKKVEKIMERLRGMRFGEFEAKLAEIGTFSYDLNPRIVWVKVGGKGVFELQKKIDEMMEKEGFAREERFMSHMTIARIKYVKDKEGFKDYVRNLGVKEIEFPVKSFKLMKSDLREMGPVYTLLEEFILS